MKQEINDENLGSKSIADIISDFFKEHERFVAEVLKKYTKEQIMMDVLIGYNCFFKYLCTYESDLDLAIEELKKDYNIDEDEVLKFFIAQFKIYCQQDDDIFYKNNPPLIA